MSGINSKAQLAAAEAMMQQRLRQAALDAGVTLVAPETVFLAADTKFGRDVTVEPYVVFGPGVTVEDGATIRSFSHLHGAHVGKDAIVGPYARLRPGAKLGEKVAHRQFRRGQGGDDRGRRQGQSPDLYRRRARRRGRQHRRRHDHLQLRRRRPSTAPTSARAPSSARIRRWWRRSRSAMAPISARARSSPRTCRPTRWRSSAPSKPLRKAGPSACAASNPQARSRSKRSA